MTQERTITVCDQCLQATCWYGLFMCDRAQLAGTVTPEAIREYTGAIE